MKKIVGIFVVLILLVLANSTIIAQEQYGNGDGNTNALREVEERSSHWDNWFISASLNGLALHAEQDRYYPLGKRIKFGGALTVGKWFNPNFGGRIQFMAGSLQGGNLGYPQPDGYWVHKNYKHHSEYPMGGPWGDANGPNPAYVALYTPIWYDVVTQTYSTNKTPVYCATIWQKFKFYSFTADVLANLSNLFRGYYKEDSWFDAIIFAGLGANRSLDNGVTKPDYINVVAKVGFRFNFNVTNNLAIYLEPQINATEREFDGYAGTALGDAYSSLGLGLQYTFNKGFYDNRQLFKLTADEIDRLNRKINENRYLIERHQDILERQQDMLERLENGNRPIKEVITQIVDNSSLPEYVRFVLDSYRIERSEMPKITEAAAFLKANPGSKLLLVGYADRKTGNPSYNFSLSKKRVDAVAAELRRQGISSNRLIIEWKGDREQPFPQNDWNRVVIMVERK